MLGKLPQLAGLLGSVEFPVPAEFPAFAARASVTVRPGLPAAAGVIGALGLSGCRGVSPRRGETGWVGAGMVCSAWRFSVMGWVMLGAGKTIGFGGRPGTGPPAAAGPGAAAASWPRTDDGVLAGGAPSPSLTTRGQATHLAQIHGIEPTAPTSPTAIDSIEARS